MGRFRLININRIVISISRNHLFLIGAYRSNEIKATHSLKLIIDEIKQQEIANVNFVNLSPLKLSDINHLLADSFKCSLTDGLPLAQLIHGKTQGNPFFVKEFLQSLYTDKLLYFDSQLGKWQWNINKIKSQDITSNVV